ncbi:MAG TPA: YncE family protein [Acidobacteriaceae bacterium]
MKQPAVVRKLACAAACALLFPFSGMTAFAQKVIATIPAQEGSDGLPMTIAVNPLTQLVYIAGNGVEVVNQRSNTPVRTIDIGQDQLSGIAINPATRRLYVTDFNTGLYVVDLTTNAVVGHFPLPVANSVTYSPRTNRIYTLDNEDNVWVNDGTTGALIKEIVTLPANSSALGSTITINPATNLIYIPQQTTPGQVLVVNAVTNAVTTVPLEGSGSFYAGVDPLRNIIYISDSGNAASGSQVDVLNGATNKEIALVTGIPLQAEALSVNPLTRQVYLSNANGTVEVIDGKTNTLTATVIPVGTNPIFSTIDLVHGLLYVGNTAEFQPGTQSVSVIKLN